MKSKHFPRHLMYYIHAGELMSTDVDLEKYIEFSESKFYGDAPLLLKDLKPDALEDLIFEIQATIIDPNDVQYRTQSTYVKTKQASNMPIKDLVLNQAADVPKERTLVRQLLVEKFEATRKKAEGRELTHYVLGEFDNLLRLWMKSLKRNKKNYETFKQWVSDHMHENKRAIFKTTDGEILENTDFNPEIEKCLHLVIKYNRAVREKFISFFKKEYVDAYGAKHAKMFTREQKIKYNMTSHSTEAAWAGLDADEKKELLSILSMGGLFNPAFPDEIPEKMKSYCDELLNRLNSDNDPIDTASWVFKEYCNIHPYANGTGRVARYLMNRVLDQNGLPTLSFEDDEEYMKHVIAANDEYIVFKTYLESKLVEMETLMDDMTRYDEKFPEISSMRMKEIVTVCKKAQALVDTWNNECMHFDPLDRDGSFTRLKTKVGMQDARGASFEGFLSRVKVAEESGNSTTKGRITFINL